jgi:precorrin-3B synthase
LSANLSVRSPRHFVSGNTVRDHPADLPIPRLSACPGLLRIVQALDGGICRVKLPGGLLSSQQARAIAEAATRCASGVLELTNRSNMQIRGVRSGLENELIQRLLDASLGPRTLDADDVRNLLLSPAAGLDPAAHLDTRPLATELLALLQDTPTLHKLSPKFSIQLDGGERLNMLQHPHDIWFSALPGTPGTPGRLAFGLAGCPVDQPLGVIEVDQLRAFTHALLQTFLRLAEPSQHRMRELLARIDTSGLLSDVQSQLPFLLQAGPRDWHRSDCAPGIAVGIFEQRQPERMMVVAGARLGRIEAHQLQALAALSDRYAGAELRLTPWQGVLLPNVLQGESQTLRDELSGLGLLTDASDPLAGLIACTGSAGCGRGLADTKADAVRLADLMRRSGARARVHLSGCPRSCAAAHVAGFTLLATETDGYTLYERVPGEQGERGFGRPLKTSLTIEQAGDWFAARHLTGNTDA